MSSNGLVHHPGAHAIRGSQIAVEHDLLSAHDPDLMFDFIDRDERCLLFGFSCFRYVNGSPLSVVDVTLDCILNAGERRR